MRVLGLIGLVVALLIVGLLAKRQIGSLTAPTSAVPAVPTGTAPSTPAQARQLQEDIRKSLDAAMRQPRSTPDDTP
ncbi:hypothetical protein [Variovorax sp. ZT4R33]|uniref:hypothetical protein n=1 Tax=Variovorax sp. ZT4R33 TaxID=3443743 RepID=UPI003F469D3A